MASAVCPSGRFVYASNRGHDSIAIFAVDHAQGTPRPGADPGQDPALLHSRSGGELSLRHQQDSDTIVTFRVDPATGTLTPTGQVSQTGSPVCIIFAGG